MEPRLASRSAIVVITSMLIHETPKVSKSQFKERWKLGEEKAMKNIYCLPIPIFLQQHLLNFCQPISQEIHEWCVKHLFLFDNKSCNLQNILCWTSFGILDYKRTAEHVLESCDLIDRFRTACMYCFEEKIHAIPIASELSFDSIYFEALEVQFWVRYLRDDVETFRNALRIDQMSNELFEFAFHLATISNNYVSAEYFLLKIKPEWQQKIINHTIINILKSQHRFTNGQMLNMLLSHLNEPHKQRLLQMYPKNAAMNFLNWSLLPFFWDVLNLVLESFNEISFYQLLQDILYCMIDFDQSDIYPNLFEKVWHIGSMEFKVYVISKFVNHSFFVQLAAAKNTEKPIKLMLLCLTKEEKIDMLFSDNGITGMFYLIKAEKWKTVAMVFNECLPLDEKESLLSTWIVKYKKILPLIHYGPGNIDELLEFLSMH